MIVDSHAHVFPPIGGPSRHPTTRQHMRYVQHMLRFHHQLVRRLDDDSTLTGQSLVRGTDYYLDGHRTSA